MAIPGIETKIFVMKLSRIVTKIWILSVTFRRLTWECIDVNDSVLASLVVDDDVNPKERYSQGLSQASADHLNDVVTWHLGLPFQIVPLESK